MKLRDVYLILISMVYEFIIPYAKERLADSPFSPFPQVLCTERADAVNASLLEGRIGILVDGTPNALIVPATMTMLMQASEDYYQRFIASTWIRWIRYLFLFVSVLLPSIYIAVTTFIPEMIPSKLLTTIAVTRLKLSPFQQILEAIVYEKSVEALREASIDSQIDWTSSVSIMARLLSVQQPFKLVLSLRRWSFSLSRESPLSLFRTLH